MDKIIIGDAIFYHGDCLDIMPTLPDKSVDLVLTDPPYGINEAAGKNKSRGKLAEAKDYGDDAWDKNRPDKKYFNEMIILSVNQIIFGGNYFSDYLKPSSCWIVWDKDNGRNDFADCEMAWTSFNSAVRKIVCRWNGFMQEPGSKRDVRVHPTQKPVGLFSQVLKNYSKKDDLICDPFIGSGTTAIACYRTGRKFIGIEKEKKYFDIAVERYRREHRQLRLTEMKRK
jgi:DNA modification methylase